jgi:hypothetical protein
MLSNPKLTSEKNIIEEPIKPLITLKKEKTAPTKSEMVKSKKKSKRKKDSAKKRRIYHP